MSLALTDSIATEADMELTQQLYCYCISPESGDLSSVLC